MQLHNVSCSQVCTIYKKGNEFKKKEKQPRYDSDDSCSSSSDEGDESQPEIDTFDSEMKWWVGVMHDIREERRKIMARYLGSRVTMSKCSVCNVTRFCNRVCQKACYAKQTWLNVGVMISHKHMCPLLMQWKQFKKGNTVIEDCVAMQMGFLEACHPFQNILQRGEFFDEYVY